jgi:hypothetical protein
MDEREPDVGGAPGFDSAEERLVEHLLRRPPGPGRAWRVGVGAGACICLSSIVIVATGLWPNVADYFLLHQALGLIVIEASLDRRRRGLLASVVRKYDQALREPGQGEQRLRR